MKANSSLVAKIRNTFLHEIQEDRLVYVNCVIASTPGSVRFAINRGPAVSGSSDPTFVERDQKTGAGGDFVAVEALGLIDLARTDCIPYYSDFDIADMHMASAEALFGCPSLPKQSLIKSSVILGEASFEKAFTEPATLCKLGYREFKYGDQSTFDRLDGELLTVKKNSGSFSAYLGSRRAVRGCVAG